MFLRLSWVLMHVHMYSIHIGLLLWESEIEDCQDYLYSFPLCVYMDYYRVLTYFWQGACATNS